MAYNATQFAKHLSAWRDLASFEQQTATKADWCEKSGLNPTSFSNLRALLLGFECISEGDNNTFTAVNEPTKELYGWVDREKAKAEREQAEAERKAAKEAKEPPGKTSEEEMHDRDPDEQPSINTGRWISLARDFVKENYRRGSRRLIYYRGNFYRWTGIHYVVIDDDAINSQIYMWLDKPTVKARNEVRNGLQAMTHVDREFQAPAWLSGNPRPATDNIACQNGLLSISTGELLSHSSDFLTMNALPCKFDPDAKAPRWEQFLREVWPDDPASIEALQEMFGYFISRDLSQQKLFMLIGPKRSGKGTIARVLKELLGGDQNVASPTLTSLRDKSGLEGLIDKTAAIIGDVRLEGYGNHELVERLLSISGQDGINVFRKFKQDWCGTLGVRFLIISNNLPTFSDASGAIISRFLVLRTQQSFMGREDTALTNKLLEELPGILNWSLEGLRRLHARGHFLQPESGQADIDELEDQASPVLAWGKARCVLDPGITASSDELAADYEEWREANKYNDIPRPHFFRQLRAAFPNVRPGKAGGRGDQQRCYRGIGLIGPTPKSMAEEFAEVMAEQDADVIDLQSRRAKGQPGGM